jgi:uncharacterized protein YndB with AHSA1/START domain
VTTVESGLILSGGRSIEKELFIRAAPERVFQALTVAGELERWFVDAARYDARPGGPLWLHWDSNGTAEGRYLVVDAPHRLVYEWSSTPGNTRVTIELTPEADGTRLRLHEVGFGEGADWDALFAGETNGWGPLLEALKTWVETGKERRR